MKILKNALSALTRYKLFTALNILGLTIVLCVVYILLIPAYNALTYNRGIKDCERLYVLTHNIIPSQPRSEFFPPGIVHLLCDDNPYVECYSYKRDIEYILIGNRVIECLPLQREHIGLYCPEIIDGSWERVFKYESYAVSRSYAKKTSPEHRRHNKAIG